MISISSLKIRPDQGMKEIRAEVRRILHLAADEAFTAAIWKSSLDARKKPDLFLVCTVHVSLERPELEKRILRKNRDQNVTSFEPVSYRLPEICEENSGDSGDFTGKSAASGKCGKAAGTKAPSAFSSSSIFRPVIVGAGPAGLFCALVLSNAKLKPIILERGLPVDERTEAVEKFWAGGALDPECNVQFGEGGAGTFSDGKLNTQIKDRSVRFVLETFQDAGADPEILYSSKPHIGTDLLRTCIKNIRARIEELGGEFRFSTCLTGLTQDASGIWHLTGRHGKIQEELLTKQLVLAIGHSARDTFFMLRKNGFAMHAKAFAVGVRIQHPQHLIDEALYGKDCRYSLPPSSYKLTHHLGKERGVYSFCMCPGGYVVNASSEKGMLAVNGMSNHGRDSGNANSAIVVTISPEEIQGWMRMREADPVLSGIAFQRHLEMAAFRIGQGAVPVQRFEAFRQRESRDAPMAFEPRIKGAFRQANLREIFPEEISQGIEEGILAWDKQIPGFASPEALLAGVESRTSSPIRLERTESLEALGKPGLYPCGEGAGYAGGITSAAVDGLRVGEQIVLLYGSKGLSPASSGR